MQLRVVTALICLGVALLPAARRRMLEPLSEAVEGVERYVDAGIQLHVVVADDQGVELLRGKPRVRIVRTHHLGGMIDTTALQPYVCDRSPNPVHWFCSEDQEPVILHADSDPLGQLVYGSEGAGKTTALAMWHVLRWLEHIGEAREGGQTAPTGARLELVRAEMARLWRPSWYRYKVAEEVFIFCDGTVLRMLATYRQSAAGGPPVQGSNWSWAGRDETQDQVEAHEDIQSRGRSARVVAGELRYKQLATATAKDSSAWRTLRDTLTAARLAGAALWIRRTLLIARSPFIAPNFLAIAAQSVSPREFKRRYLAQDLPPERATYPCWDRASNLIRLPAGWVDCTAQELAPWGANLAALGGHDPGALFDVTLVLKAYRSQISVRPIWLVVDEITTEQTTTEQHLAVLLERLRKRWRLNLLDRSGRTTSEGPRILIRADPYGNNDSKPDRSCYTILRNAGLTVHPAAYNAEGDGPGRVPKDAGIEVVNTLLCSAAMEHALYIALTDTGAPCAPKLVEALETSERDLAGKAETQPKTLKDVSHWPAALRYSLWAIERPRLLALAAAAAAAA